MALAEAEEKDRAEAERKAREERERREAEERRAEEGRRTRGKGKQREVVDTRRGVSTEYSEDGDDDVMEVERPTKKRKADEEAEAEVEACPRCVRYGYKCVRPLTK